MTGAQVNPARVSLASAKALHKAFLSRQTISVKAFSTVDSLLPAELDPQVVGKIHEHRLLDRIPTISTTAPSYEFVIHQSTTGSPGVTAEGALKPEVTPVPTSAIVPMVKLALNSGISHETLSDWPQWLTYVEGELMAQLVDLENSQVLSGSGAGNITGFLSTSGILTHNFATDPPGTTSLDAVELSIAQMRVSVGVLAEPDLLVLHPQTWAALRRTKDTAGHYIIAADPTRDNVNSLWGIDVLVTTAMTAGQGLLLDTHKFGHAVIREGIVMHMGYTGTDFTSNVSRIVMEERLNLAVMRPTAVLSIAGLPVS